MMKYNLKTVNMAIIKKTRSNKHWQGWGEKGTFTHSWWKYKLVQSPQKTIWRFLKILKTDSLYYPSILLLGVYSGEMKTVFWQDTWTLMFIAALLTITMVWKQSRSPWIDEWTKKDGCEIYTMEYYLAMRKGDILPFATKWMDPEHIMLSR